MPRPATIIDGPGAIGIVEVAQSMLDSRRRRRPVILDGPLVGQVSSSNILWALVEFQRRKVVN